MKRLLFSIITSFNFSAMAINPVDSLPQNVKSIHLSLSNNQCDTNLYSDSEIFKLEKGVTLYIVPCAMGAYQGYSYAYTVDQFENVIPVLTLTYDESVKGISSSYEHGEANYDEKKKLFTTFSKGRGLGDCGRFSASKVIVGEYGYVGVKTIEVRSKEKCDGKMTTWPVRFSQK